MNLRPLRERSPLGQTGPGEGPETPKLGRPRLRLALVPLILMAGLVAVFLAIGPRGVFPGDFPPVEDLTIGAPTLRPGEIGLTVTNGGPSPVTISQVLVDDAYWQHAVSPSRTIGRLKSSTVTIPYPWVEGEPVEIALVSSTGLTFTHTIDVATETPAPNARFLMTFLLLGTYIGVIPVLLGMTWRPFISPLSPGWLRFFMAFTAGVLAFLGAETLVEAIERSGEAPTALGGIGLVVLGGLGAFSVILAGSRRLQRTAGIDRRLIVAVAVAAGIGLHNLGEGLAVGAAYRLGEIALGAFLVIGFAIHNVTEGVGIVSVLGDRKTALGRLVGLGLLAGVPTIFGAWIGGFFFSPVLATIFLAVAAGAIAQVIVEVLGVVRAQAPGGLASVEALLGIAAGVAVMYATGLLVTA